MNRFSKYYKNLHDDDIISILLGVCYFIIISLSRYFSNDVIGLVDLKVWITFDDLYQQLKRVEYVTSYIIMVVFSIFLIFCVHYIKFKSINIDCIFYLFLIITVFISKIIGTSFVLRTNGFGTSIWCIIFGCIYRIIYRKYNNKNKLTYEFFIKISIVIFVIDLTKVVNIGLKGLLVGWCETVILVLFLYFTGVYLFKMDCKTVLISVCGLSICGSSAVISVSDVLKYDVDNVMIITIMTILTIPYIPVLPILGKVFGINEQSIGMWIGGSIDSTGAVIASASLIGKKALDHAIILKMLQNLLIGPITFIVTIIWFHTLNVWILWQKFPKFVLGFLFFSGILTLYPANLKINVANDCFILSEFLSNISFVLIGLEIDIMNITNMFINWKLFLLYIFGQNIDILSTYGFVILTSKL